MKKIWILLVISSMLLAGKAFAETRFGISGAIVSIDATGSETEGGEKTNASADNVTVVPSIILETSASDRISIGLDYIPLKADVSSKTKKRTDTELSVTGTLAHTTTSRSQKANASLKNHTTLYANVKGGGNAYFKAGLSYVTLETDESLGTGSKYGNEDIYGYVVGFGTEQDNVRLELLYTDYEDISLTSSVARTGVTTNNKIEADLDTLQLKLSYLF